MAQLAGKTPPSLGAGVRTVCTMGPVMQEGGRLEGGAGQEGGRGQGVYLWNRFSVCGCAGHTVLSPQSYHFM